MTPTLEAQPSPAPRISPGSRVHLVPAAPSLWRVLDPRGRVIGHLQRVTEPGGDRYRARRFHAATHDFRDLGDFWNADDAIECLRFAR